MIRPADPTEGQCPKLLFVESISLGEPIKFTLIALEALPARFLLAFELKKLVAVERILFPCDREGLLACEERGDLIEASDGPVDMDDGEVKTVVEVRLTELEAELLSEIGDECGPGPAGCADDASGEPKRAGKGASLWSLYRARSVAEAGGRCDVRRLAAGGNWDGPCTCDCDLRAGGDRDRVRWG